MRLSGSFLIILGGLLCASVAWAAIGFFAMALGLICLQIPTKQVPVSCGAVRKGVVSSPSVEQTTVSTCQGSTFASAEGSGAWKAEPDWDILVARDEDLANVERLLSRYGSIYVNQLRTIYGVFNNKALLPSILSLIVESTRHEAGQTASVLASVREGRKPDTSVPARGERPIEVVDSMAVPPEPESSIAGPSGDEEEFLSQSDDLYNADAATLEGRGEASPATDVEDIVNLSVIFDQLSHNKN